VTNELTIAVLKDECRTREEKGYSSEGKDALLHRLGLGSVCISMTSAWKDLQEVYRIIKAEKAALARLRQEEIEKTALRSLELRIIEEEKREDQRRKAEAKREETRRAEMIAQTAFHTNMFVNAHPHPLAPTSALQFHGLSRIERCICSKCYVGEACIWTCEACDFDICASCFDFEKLSPTEKQTWLAEEEARREREAQQLENQRQQREKQRKKEAAAHLKELVGREEFGGPFPTNIRVPPNKNRTANHGYTVWSSTKFPYDEPSGKEFDSSYATLELANKRAMYLFYFENSMGIPPDEMESFDGPEISRKYHEERALLSAKWDGGRTWKVGVMADSDYAGVRKLQEEEELEKQEQFRRSFHHAW